MFISPPRRGLKRSKDGMLRTLDASLRRVSSESSTPSIAMSWPTISENDGCGACRVRNVADIAPSTAAATGDPGACTVEQSIIPRRT